MSEIWKDIPGLEKMYQASSLGRIRSVDRVIVRKNRWGQLNPNHHKGILLNFAKKINGAGYYSCNLGKISRDVHRVIAETFLKQPSKFHQVNHKNCNKLDNTVINLEWVLPSENIQHMMKNGRFEEHRRNMSIKSSGSGNPRALLNETMVKKIKKAIIGGFPVRLLASVYSVPTHVISNIKQNKTWRNVNV